MKSVIEELLRSFIEPALKLEKQLLQLQAVSGDEYEYYKRKAMEYAVTHACSVSNALQEITNDVMRGLKPSLGTEPKYIWEDFRKQKISANIQRYLRANLKVPIKWIEEYNKLTKEHKTAKKMFEELGYKQKPYIEEDDKCQSKYIYYEDNIGEYIKFGIMSKLFHASRSINVKEYAAIQQQIKELGW